MALRRGRIGLKRIMMKNAHISCCTIALAIVALQFVSLRCVQADTDPADRALAENHLTSGSWKITFEKGWSIVRIFAKDGTFWTPNRPDESGHWTISNNLVVQTYNSGDEREDELTLPIGADTITGTARDGGTMSAVHDKAVPTATSAPALTVQQKAAIAEMLTSAHWRIISPDWNHVYAFAKDGTFTATKKGGGYSRGQWTIDKDIITLVFTDGHKDFVLFPLDPKGTAYADKSGIPATAVLITPDAANNPAPTVAPVARPAQPRTPATPTELLLSGQWKLTTKTRNDTRVFMKDGTFKTLNDPNAKGQWMITSDFVIMLLPGGHKDVIYMPLNPKGSAGLADNGDALTAILENPAPGNDNPATASPPQDSASAADILISVPWIVSTGGDAASSRTRTFAKNGTFSTAGHEDEYGWWKIVNNIVILTFADEHKESLKLPLDPKGTSGLDKDGAPISAIRQEPAK